MALFGWAGVGTVVVFLMFMVRDTTRLLFTRGLAVRIYSVRGIRKRLCITVCGSRRAFVGGPLATFQVSIGSASLSVPYRKLPANACTVSLFRSRGKGKGLSATIFNVPARGCKFDGSTRNIVNLPSCSGYDFAFSKSAALIVRLG